MLLLSDFVNIVKNSMISYFKGPESKLYTHTTSNFGLEQFINFKDPLLLAAIFFAVFNPVAWNLGGRIEYNTRFLTKFCGNNKYLACYIFAFCIFSIGLLRDFIYKKALERQSASIFLLNIPLIDPIAHLCLITGTILVLSSMYKLGITGTYLGDHFGILKSSRITSFPFSLFEHPMYYGSTLCFLGVALRMKSPAGLLVTSILALSYGFASKYEEKFTNKIYFKAFSKNK